MRLLTVPPCLGGHALDDLVPLRAFSYYVIDVALESHVVAYSDSEESHILYRFNFFAM